MRGIIEAKNSQKVLPERHFILSVTMDSGTIFAAERNTLKK